MWIQNHTQSEPKNYIETTHEESWYPCNQCDYKATREEHLKKHKEYKHEGVRYPCDKCDYKGITEGKLKVHKESKHQGICYYCDDCQYKAATPSNLKQHVEIWHLRFRREQDRKWGTHTLDTNRYSKQRRSCLQITVNGVTSGRLSAELDEFFRKYRRS